MYKCTGEHDFFVADVAQVLNEGKVVVIALCKLCGGLQTHEVAVTSHSKKKEEK